MSYFNTITLSHPMDLRAGDHFTIAGIYVAVRNPDRKWWQFWKPRFVADPAQLRMFAVTNG